MTEWYQDPSIDQDDLDLLKLLMFAAFGVSIVAMMICIASILYQFMHHRKNSKIVKEWVKKLKLAYKKTTDPDAAKKEIQNQEIEDEIQEKVPCKCKMPDWFWEIMLLAIPRAAWILNLVGAAACFIGMKYSIISPAFIQFLYQVGHICFLLGAICTVLVVLFWKQKEFLPCFRCPVGCMAPKKCCFCFQRCCDARCHPECCTDDCCGCLNWIHWGSGCGCVDVYADTNCPECTETGRKGEIMSKVPADVVVTEDEKQKIKVAEGIILLDRKTAKTLDIFITIFYIFGMVFSIAIPMIGWKYGFGPLKPSV